MFIFEESRFSALSLMIHLKESKSTDIHGVTCETTKMSTSDFSKCDFEQDEGGQYGSFSFKPINSSDDVQCSQLLQTGFKNIKHILFFTPSSHS